VTGRAPLIHEDRQTRLLRRRQRILLTPEEEIKRRIVRLSRESRGEQVAIARNAFQLLGHMRRWRRHLDRVSHRPASLLFEVFGPAVPELHFVEYRI
jgi:hypothetical protein